MPYSKKQLFLQFRSLLVVYALTEFYGCWSQYPTEATVLAAAPLHVLSEAGVLPVRLTGGPLVGAVVGGVGGHALGAGAQPAALTPDWICYYSPCDT